MCVYIINQYIHGLSPSQVSHVLVALFHILCFHFQGKYCACPSQGTRWGPLTSPDLTVPTGSPWLEVGTGEELPSRGHTRKERILE